MFLSLIIYSPNPCSLEQSSERLSQTRRLFYANHLYETITTNLFALFSSQFNFRLNTHLFNQSFPNQSVCTCTRSVLWYSRPGSRFISDSFALFTTSFSLLNGLNYFANIVFQISLQSSFFSLAGFYMNFESPQSISLSHFILALSANSPQYLAALIRYHQPVRSLRSSDQHYHLLTKCTTNFGSRSFRCSAPAIWNSIPIDFRSLQTIDAFKRGLKTHYFCFPPA